MGHIAQEELAIMKVEEVLGLRVAEFADGIVWLGLVVSRSEAAGILLQPITP